MKLDLDSKILVYPFDSSPKYIQEMIIDQEVADWVAIMHRDWQDDLPSFVEAPPFADQSYDVYDHPYMDDYIIVVGFHE